MRPLDQRRDEDDPTACCSWRLDRVFRHDRARAERRASEAPQAQPTRPPAFFSEGWKALSTPPDDHGAWPASQAGVASSNVELQLHGQSAKEIQLVSVRGSPISIR
jgi:hypothetical protein